MIATKKLLSVLFTGAIAATAAATDYYVAEDGAYDGAPDGARVYASLDEAIAAAGNDFDVIYAEPGTYTTKTESGPNLKAKLIGTGTSRDDVVIKSDGRYRTLRMAADSWLENVTVVGEGTWAADRGGAIEMFGGTVTNCVIRDGKATAKDKQAGGNLYVDADTALVVACEISGGEGKNHGGNVCLVKGTIRACTITSGITSDEGEKHGANIWMSGGLVDSCTVSDGNGYEGGEIYMTGGTVTNSTIFANGITRGSGGGIYMYGSGCVVSDSTIDGEDGTMSWHGGCIYMKRGTVRNTVCRNGSGRKGGNVFMENGRLENVRLENGTCTEEGGNLFVNGGVVNELICRGGTAGSDGGNICAKGTVTISDAQIADGTIVTDAEKKGCNVYMDGSVKLIRAKVTGGTSYKANGMTPGYDGGSLCVYSASASVEDTLVEGSTCGGVLLGTTSYLYNLTVVNNQKWGVWSWSPTQHLFNCIIFGNTRDNGTTREEWHGNEPNASDAHFLNCATSEGGTLSQATYPTLVYVTEGDFAGYANGNYQPGEGSGLVDAGVADPRGPEASSTDLAGNPRESGTIDIGCYEYQKREMTVRIVKVAYSSDWAPSTVTFTHATENSASHENIFFTYNFGDGSANETTTELTINHKYERPGVYTVKITAKNECEEELAEMTHEGYVRVASSTVYVRPGNAGAAFPYDTPETGYASLAAAVDAAYDGYTLRLNAGVYESSKQISVTKALTIVGMGATPEAVVLRNTTETPDIYYRRTIELTKAGASLANVTIENGKVKNQYGGNLRIAGGACVSNCVIRGGLAWADGGNAAGAGVVLSGTGSTITHCVISNNVVQGTSSEGAYAGGAVFIECGAKNIRLSNLLIAGNRYAPSNNSKSGTAGVRYGGDNNSTTMENCTIAGNEVAGSLPQDSAALYCPSWHVLFYNNIFVGNRETEKEGGRRTSVKLDFSDGSGYKYVSNITDDVAIGGSTSKSSGNRVASAESLFADFARGDFTLKPGCAAYNAGKTAELALKPSVDLAGNPRIFDATRKARIDIGCYECQRRLGMTLVIR